MLSRKLPDRHHFYLPPVRLPLTMLRGLVLCGLCLAMPVAAIAQAFQEAASVERDQDILYSADGGGSIETSGDVRTTVLRTNVRIQQGHVTIFGNTATLEQDTLTGDLIRVTVEGLEGEPARFSRETQSAEDEPINGHSHQIVYYNEPGDGDNLLSVVEFVGDANFTRGRTALQCARIKHIVESGATESPGPCSGILAPVP